MAVALQESNGGGVVRFSAPAGASRQALQTGGRVLDVGVFAHNEANNIADVLQSLTAGITHLDGPRRILVYSASDDGTDLIVRDHACRDNRLVLRMEAGRRGKAAAINDFLKESDAEICVVMSADVIPHQGAIEQLSEALADERVGLVGAVVVPTNPRNQFFGFVSHLIWGIHREFDKVGELIAFRRELVQHIPDSTSVDEACIQAVVTMKGMRVACVPDAVVQNRGPDNIFDFLIQRSRIFSGHLALSGRASYQVPTMQIGFLLKAVRLSVKETKSIAHAGHIPIGKALSWLFFAAALELFARFLGALKLFLRGEETKWRAAPSTKIPFQYWTEKTNRN